MNQEKDQRPVTEWKAWIVWSCAALFFGYQFALRVSPSVMADELMSAFAIDTCALGILTAFYYNAYAFLQIPAGSLLDQFGPRKMLTCATLSCILGCSLFASAESIGWAAAGRLFIGAGSAFGFLSCLKIATTWFVPQRLPVVLGISVCLGTFGAIGGGAPLSLMVNSLGWRSTVWWLAGIGFFLLGLVLFFVRNAPPQPKIILKREAVLPFWESLLAIITKRQTWLIAFYGILMYVPLSAFADLWGVKFLVEVYKIEKTMAAQAISNIYIGMGIGSLFFPLLCQRLKAYRPGLYISASMTTLLFLIILMNSSFSIWLLSILLFLMGGFIAGQFLGFSVVCELNPRQVSATAAGFQNMVCMMSGVIFQPLIGYFLQFYSLTPGNYQPSDYIFALSSIPIATLGAFFLVFLIHEVYPQSSLENAAPLPKEL